MNRQQRKRDKANNVWHTLVISSPWSWFKKGLLFIIFSLLVNHLATRENFPLGDSYKFPKEGFISSIVLCFLIAMIADINFNYYKKKYFARKVEVSSIALYMFSTLGYVVLMYYPLAVIFNRIAGGEIEFYYLLLGLSITLLLSFVLISITYVQEIYHLYQRSTKDAEITIESGPSVKKLTYENLACFYSQNKIVYAIQNDGKQTATDFTLTKLEEKLNDQLFFRANRQLIVHKNAIEQIRKIENGKLRISLKDSIKNNSIVEVVISRYKRQAFLEWFH